jgi:hypothetical protein
MIANMKELPPALTESHQPVPRSLSLHDSAFFLLKNITIPQRILQFDQELQGTTLVVVIPSVGY